MYERRLKGYDIIGYTVERFVADPPAASTTQA
jgi:hypothetical protein